MGRFIAPEWQRGYRYISLEEKVAAVRAERPVPILMTHDLAGPPGGKSDFCVVSRIAMLINTGEGREWFHECGARRHTYHPWGIENGAKTSSGRLDVSLTTLPLAGRSAFLVKAGFVNVSSRPMSISLSFVVGGVGLVEDPRMVPEFSEAENDVLSHHDGTICIFDQQMRDPKIHVAACCTRSWDVRTIDYRDVFDKTPHELTCPLALATVSLDTVMPGADGVAYLALVYGEDETGVQTSAGELVGRAEVEEERMVTYFTDLLDKTCITTPSRDLDNAFIAAVCDLEYTWWDKLGWMEIVSYWNGFFQQSQTLGAASIGQMGRVKDCLLACGLKIDEAGRIPLMTFRGDGWGRTFDWTHYFILGLDYFYRSTGDVDVLRLLWPHVVRAYDRCFSENADPEGLLFSWNKNFLEVQEDDIFTPYHGSSPTIIGIMMNQKMAGFCQALDLKLEAKRYQQKETRAKALLQEKFWDVRRGTFIYWIDEEGVEHFESPHHTYSWPVNFEISDLLDSYTSLRHLRETLISPRGIVYNSNQFPEDRLSCLGAQESIFATGSVAVACGRMGDRDTCLRILEGASRCIVNEPHEGQVPEQAQIDFQSYLSSSAAGFAWGVAEGLFGIRWNVPANELRLEPCLPSSWPGAQIKLENLTWKIEQSQNQWNGTVTTSQCIGRRFRVKLPPCRIESCLVGDKHVEWSVEPAIDGIFVIVKAPAEHRTEIFINHQPLPVDFRHQEDMAEGDLLVVEFDGCRVLEVIDRSQVVEDVDVSKHSVKMRLKTDTAGLRPTVFLRCHSEQTEFYQAIPIFVHQKLDVVAAGDAVKLDEVYFVEVMITDWTERPIGGQYCLRILDQQAAEKFELDKGTTQTLRLPLSQSMLARLSPGKNVACLNFPGGEKRTFAFNLVAPFVDSATLRSTLADRLEYIDLVHHYSHRFEEIMELKEDLLDRAVAPDRAGPQFLSEIVPGQREIADPGTGLRFQIRGRQAVLAAHGLSAKVPLNGSAEKIYVLTVSCLGSEDTYSEVGRIGVTYEDGTGEEIALTIPGNINWGFYYRGWESSLKWYQGLSIVLPGTVLDIVEIPCDPRKTAKHLNITTCGRRPVIGLLGVTVLNPG